MATTIVLTPEGMVEAGEDFAGNRRPEGSVKIEVGSVFEGNAPISTPTPTANIKFSV